jgi:hypothetical protein
VSIDADECAKQELAPSEDVQLLDFFVSIAAINDGDGSGKAVEFGKKLKFIHSKDFASDWSHHFPKSTEGVGYMNCVHRDAGMTYSFFPAEDVSYSGDEDSSPEPTPKKRKRPDASEASSCDGASQEKKKEKKNKAKEGDKSRKRKKRDASKESPGDGASQDKKKKKNNKTEERDQSGEKKGKKRRKSSNKDK